MKCSQTKEVSSERKYEPRIFVFVVFISRLIFFGQVVQFSEKNREKQMFTLRLLCSKPKAKSWQTFLGGKAGTYFTLQCRTLWTPRKASHFVNTPVIGSFRIISKNSQSRPGNSVPLKFIIHRSIRRCLAYHVYHISWNFPPWSAVRLPKITSITREGSWRSAVITVRRNIGGVFRLS